MIRIYLVNQLADTTILLLVRRHLYSEKTRGRMVAGGVLSALSFMIWFMPAISWPGWARILSCLLLMGILPGYIYQVETVHLLLLTCCSVFLWSALLAGSMIITLRFLPPGLPGRLLISCLLASAFCLLMDRVLPDTAGIPGQQTKGSQGLYQVTIIRGERRVSCSGLYDSGNLLKSQITGAGICVLNGQKGKLLLGKEERDLLNQKKELWYEGGIYPVEYRTVGCRGAIMPGILADRIIVRKEEEILADKKGMVALSEEVISGEGRFGVLLPEDIFDR
ncbi:MAG: sigma-E processing peptidase SpoIIGA [Eubacterium sp.]|nr:sigma-E processing peptidase SpoIIGA [Eubacterium sp.]